MTQRERDSSFVAEAGRFGRILTARVRPNQDLVTAIEEICRDHGLTHAVVRGCVGSLNDAVMAIGTASEPRIVAGPGLEIAITQGEVRSDSGEPRARLYGIVADSTGQAYAGEFLRGRNLTFVTLELILQEWLPDDD